jgi:hypothetical protein
LAMAANVTQTPPLPPGVRHRILRSGREDRMAVTIVLEEEPYRLITDGGEHYAVIEARDGRVYSLGCIQHGWSR